MNESKKALCESIIKEYCMINKKTIDELTEQDVYNSSTLGLSLKYLKLREDIVLNSEIATYLQNRDGVMNIYTNGFALTLKDILEDKYKD